MNEPKIIFLIWYFLVCSNGQTDETLLSNDTFLNIVEVDDGKSAKLLCRSNDEHHFFSFWQLANEDAVMGPGQIFNDTNFNYEVLSGNLFIRRVSSKEEGIYHCVSRGVTNNDINICAVRMVVNKDWSEVDQHDPGVNYFRGVVVVASLLIIAAVIYFAYRMKKKHRLQSLLDAPSDEEDSTEEIFRSPGTSKGTENIVIDPKDIAGIPKISIDFENIRNNSQNK